MAFKLVRDLIPTLAPDKKFVTAPDWALDVYVQDKILEEAREVIQALGKTSTTEELADLLEVMQKYAKVQGITWDEVLEAKAKKLAAKGGFDKDIILITKEAPKT